MRIAQLVPPFNPTPPPGFGGSELVAGTLIEQLVRRGHEVVLFAHPDSTAPATLVTYPDANLINQFDRRELAYAARVFARAGEFDIIHNHCLSAGPALAGLTATPCLSTLHYLHPVHRCFPAHPIVAISHAQARALPELNILAVVHNGVACERYPLVTAKDDYLLYMGRIDEKKGPDRAIQVARRLGCRLIIAGRPPPLDMVDYFETEVRPYLGPDIVYVGEARGADKIELLAHARCALLPIRWEEPFGLVAVEAMACGTPAIGMRHGALPEIIEDGVTGFLVDSVEAMAAAVERVDEISGDACRRRVEARFSAERMTEGYLAAYD